jgi:hypothetical protein
MSRIRGVGRASRDRWAAVALAGAWAAAAPVLATAQSEDATVWRLGAAISASASARESSLATAPGTATLRSGPGLGLAAERAGTGRIHARLGIDLASARPEARLSADCGLEGSSGCSWPDSPSRLRFLGHVGLATRAGPMKAGVGGGVRYFGRPEIICLLGRPCPIDEHEFRQRVWSPAAGASVAIEWVIGGLAWSLEAFDWVSRLEGRGFQHELGIGLGVWTRGSE